MRPPQADGARRALRVLVVDDEPLGRERIRALLAGHADVEVAGECADGRSAVDAIRTLRPDVVFLDVQMPELDGFGVLDALDAPPPAIVFVTAHDRHALRAFEVHAVDYLLKPFDRARFEDALATVRRRLAVSDASEAEQRLLAALADVRAARGRAAERLVLRVDGRVVLVRPQEVAWIEAAGNHCCVHAAGTAHVVRESLAAIEARLDPRRFPRVHRSALVHLERVREVRPGRSGEGCVLLDDGTEVPLGRSYKDRLLELLDAS